MMTLPTLETDAVITTGGQIILAALGLMTVWLEANRRESKRARQAAEEAASAAAPTGNGWANHTTHQLDALAGTMTELRADIERIELRLSEIEKRKLRRWL